MERIPMTFEHFHNFLSEIEEGKKEEWGKSSLYEADLKYQILPYFKLDYHEAYDVFIFFLQDGFVFLRTSYHSPALILPTMKKVDDDFLKNILREKKRWLDEVEDFDIFLSYYRLKTLFL